MNALGALYVEVASSSVDDSIFVDNAGFTLTTSKVNVAGGVYQNGTPGTLGDNDAGAILLNSTAGQMVELMASSASIGTLGANSGTDIGDVDILSIAAGDNNIGNVDIVTLPASTNTLEVVGDVAENENAAGNPVLTGGRYDSSVRTLGNTDVGALALDPTGALYVREYLGQAGSILVTGTTNAVTTGVSGTKFIAIQFLEDSTFDTGATGLVASTAGLWPDDANASTTIDANGGAVTGGEVFPQGITIFGRWDGFQLDSGKVIAYLGHV
jgi:hypothetical protein